MTYPGLTSRRQRHDVAFQFHLVRMGFTQLRQSEQQQPDAMAYMRQHWQQRRDTMKAQLGSMRDVLHTLFD